MFALTFLLYFLFSFWFVCFGRRFKLFVFAADDSEEDMMELVCAGLDMTTNMGLAAPPSMKKKKKGGFGGGGGARNARMMQSNAIVQQQQQQQQPSRGMKQKSRPTPRGMTTKAVVSPEHQNKCRDEASFHRFFSFYRSPFVLRWSALERNFF